MRAALVIAFRQGLARVVVAVGLLGLVWLGLHSAWPWAHVSLAPESAFPHFPAASAWELPVAAGVLVVGLALAVLIYRTRPVSR
jgi:hypothetical protein